MPKVTLDDIKICDCARCGLRLVAPSHAEHAHRLGLFVAKLLPHPACAAANAHGLKRVYPHKRPYCPSCHGAEILRRRTCCECRAVKEPHQVSRIGGNYICEACVEPRKPSLRQVDPRSASDRHYGSAGTVEKRKQILREVATEKAIDRAMRAAS